jgi:hypothetical protein
VLPATPLRLVWLLHASTWLQGYALQARLLEFRCGRYFYIESADTFLPVPDVPRGFNTQLQASASALAAAQDPWCVGARQAGARLACAIRPASSWLNG